MWTNGLNMRPKYVSLEIQVCIILCSFQRSGSIEKYRQVWTFKWNQNLIYGNIFNTVRSSSALRYARGWGAQPMLTTTNDPCARGNRWEYVYFVVSMKISQCFVPTKCARILCLSLSLFSDLFIFHFPSVFPLLLLLVFLLVSFFLLVLLLRHCCFIFAHLKFYNMEYMHLRQSDWDCWHIRMENKFVTVAHLQQIPELCLLIKAAATTEEGKKHAHTHTNQFTITCISLHKRNNCNM